MFGRVLELGPLTEAEALSLLDANTHIMSQILALPEVLTANDKHWILEQTHCWPALLQIACNARFETLQAGITATDWRATVREHLIASRCWHYLVAEQQTH